MCARSTSSRVPRNRRYGLVRRASPLSKIRAMAKWLALIAITQQVSCSGGGGSTNSNADSSPGITVSVSPNSSQISSGGNVQFVAVVQNASNPAVSWQVNGLAGGNSSVGTITPSGAGTATYMAPANVSAPLMVTVTVVLQADATHFGSATVTISPLPGAQISVSPANPNVVTGTSLQFSANVQNGPQAVIWEVNGIQLGNSTAGSITSSGFYTAPATIPSPPVVTITALLVTDTSVSGGTTLTVVAPPVSVSISPSTANVVSGATLQFSAAVQNSSAPVTWQVSGPIGNSGAIVSTGLDAASFSAPTSPSIPTPFGVTITAVLQTSPPVSASAGVTIISANAFAGVYSWRNDNSLTGQNPQETKLTPLSVNSGKFGKLFGCPVDGPVGSQIVAQPLYVANVTIPLQGTHNVVYVATEHDSVYAFDADTNPCQVLWQVSFINPIAGVTTVPAGDIPGQTDIVPEIGITGTPVIDPASATLYAVSKTKVSENGGFVYKQELHALDLTTGKEKFGAPETIQASVSGSGDGSFKGEISFDSLTENQRPALLLAGGKVYVGFDSYDDADPFHGWLLAYDAFDLTKGVLAVFNSTPNGSHGGIGERGAAPSSDASGNIFVATSDGTFDASNDYAETLLKLQINTAVASFTVADSFRRPNEVTLNLTQKYFSSTGVLLLPDSAGSSAHLHLAVAGDEASNLYLFDRDNLAGDGALQTLCLGTALMGTPASWVNNTVPTIYVAAAGDNLKAFPLANGAFSSPICPEPAVAASQSIETFSLFGASPLISWDGSNPNSAIVWALDTSGYATSTPAILHAYDATNLATTLYVSPSSGSAAAGTAVKFAVPTVANGKVYVGTQTELSVFGLP